MAGLAALSLAATFFQQWYPLAVTGAGAQTDALIASMAIPQFAIMLATSALSAAVTPMLALAAPKRFAAAAWSFASAAAVLAVLAAVAFWLSAAFWLPMLTHGFAPATRDIAVQLCEIQLLGLPFAAVGAVQTAALQAHGRFVRAEALGVTAQAVGMAVTVATLPTLGMAGAAWGIALRYAAAVVLLSGALGAPGQWDADAVREAWARMRPLFLGNSFARIDQLFDILLASLAGVGWVSLFNLSQQFHSAGNLVVNRAIARPLLPVFARGASQADWTAVLHAYRRSLGVTLLWCSVALLLLVIVREAPLAFLFPGFSADSLRNLWWLILASAGVLIAGSLAQVPAVGFYALGDTITPSRIAVYGMLLGVVFKAVGYLADGVAGLAVATSLYYTTNFLAMHVLFRRRIRGLT